MAHAFADEMVTDATFGNPKGQTRKTLIQLIIQYYSSTEYVRTPQQIRQDEWILAGKIRCKAWMIIPLAVLIQFCLGSLYAWSIFNKPIDTYVYDNPQANRAHITFYIALGMLGTSGAMFGPWIQSHSPRMCTIIGAVFFFSGHCTAALGIVCNNIGILYFGYGFIGGIGLGIGYVTTIDAVIQWYPNARGFASGLAVSGFGSGSVAFSSLNAALARTFSIPVVFIVLGSINFIAIMLCSMVMRPPPPNHNLPGVSIDISDNNIDEVQSAPNGNHQQQQQQQQQNLKGKSTIIGGQTVTVGATSGEPVLIITLAQALSSRDFWMLWISFFVNLVFGVVIISNLASMTTNMFGSDTPTAVATIITIGGIFNASGRLFLGWASDWLGRRRTFLFVITLQISVVLVLIFTLERKSFWLFVVLVWFATLCYGGGVGVIPATLADMFGASNMSGCHGVILTGWSVAAIGGGLTYTGIVNMLTQSHDYKLSDPNVYRINLYWILAILVCGWLTLVSVRISPCERMYPSVHGQIFRYTFAGITIRFSWGAAQCGLHDYKFLTSSEQLEEIAEAINRGSGVTDNTESDLSYAELVTNVDTKAKLVKEAECDHTSIATSDNQGTVDVKDREVHQAFDYLGSEKGSIHTTNNARASCVKLMYATPPRRACLSLFKRWRIEIVSKEEVNTVWRMYLSCALLSSTNE